MRARTTTLALLFFGTMINYTDRTVLAIAAPQLAIDLHIGPVQMGLLFSAFSWSYMLTQVPAGLFLDRVGIKATYALSVVSWSIFVLLHSLGSGFRSLLACRLSLGVAEAPCFPVNSSIVRIWFRPHERALATAIYTAGEYSGLLFFGPILFWITSTLGWRAMFVVVGMVGILFGPIWWTQYREAEIGVDSAPRQKAGWSIANIRTLVTSRLLIGLSLGQFAGSATLVFFLTWVPTYLATERHMSGNQLGFASVLPFVGGGVGALLAGSVSDLLLRRTGSLNLSRKLPIIVGLLLASSLVVLNFVRGNSSVVTILSLAFLGQGFVSLGWAVISDIAPSGAVGLTAGVFNVAANWAGIVTPILIGVVVRMSGTFRGALWFIAVVSWLGVVAHVLIVGDIDTLQLDS